MTKIDDFKAFVKTKPSLIGYVKNGSMTWQKFYEVWDLYGPFDEEWNKYPTLATETDTTPKQEAFGWNEIVNMVKKLDMATVQKNLTGIQKAIGLVQDMTNKGAAAGTAAGAANAYTPRPIYRKFED